MHAHMVLSERVGEHRVTIFSFSSSSFFSNFDEMRRNETE
jgi:hypothetical protein